MERYSDTAIDIINDLHADRLDYHSEYMPLINAAQVLEDYENLEEQGKLIKLPCKPGDTVWLIYDSYITTARVLALYIDQAGGLCDLRINTNKETSTGFQGVINKDNYTFNDVFLTKEEAEAALKGANNDQS
ncbi:MAG: hypothetical protein J1G06_08615 [Oscillospiraceae bacterium]|nr:hypothetical protein [Oscillospiraceae bacterium]